MFRIYVVLLALFSSFGANAASVTWTLSNVNFTNGSTATGSFDYDRDTSSFTNIDISLSAGTGFEAQTFDAIAPRSGNPYGAIFTTLLLSYEDTPYCNAASQDTSCGTHAMSILLAPGEMTNAGGVLDITDASLLHCGYAICNEEGNWAFKVDYSAAQGASISAVPIPAGVWLFGSALMALGLVKRKKT